MNKFIKSRYSIAYSFIILFLLLSSLVRLSLLFITLSKINLTNISVLSVFFKGFVYDFGISVFFCLLYIFYLLLIPQRWNRSRANRIITYIGFFIVILIIMFSFFAEFTFWGEFESRLNFIAVDYLIYTYEVFHNINESYPLPFLISGMVAVTAFITWIFYKRKIFFNSFNSPTSFIHRIIITFTFFLVGIFYLVAVKNSWAENSTERYQNELSKAGIYSFFAAFKGNELNYEDFYKLIDNKIAFNLSKECLHEPVSVFSKDEYSLRRTISSTDSLQRPNVIMITVESLSADFLKNFGNNENITPVLDSLAANSIFFTNLYATGNRTVRGMEALSLSIPPTPGSSIVRRENNDGLITTGWVFKKAGYDCSFFYGGDGYFDNMNKFFGDNGYDVTDRGRHLLPGDAFVSKHSFIADSSVHFENAWGICDEDLYDAVIREADIKHKEGSLFYDFVMTTSNHKPYTYPSGKINIVPGSRQGAVKYTDYAIGKFLNTIKSKAWYQNTVIILIADHCASSAGKNEVDISKYHIPCWILNLSGVKNQSIDRMCSQIDVYPTLFNLAGWTYESNFFGQNILSDKYVPRMFCATYQKLAYMKNDSLVILGPQRTVQTFIYNRKTNIQTPADFSRPVNEAVAQYQAAYYLFKHGGLKQ